MARFVLAGHPVAHSRSPEMHRAAYAACGLSHTYDAVDVDAEGLAQLVADLRAGAIAGLNVTVPHKITALGLADVVEESARVAGAANVLACEDGKVVALNTDIEALRYALLGSWVAIAQPTPRRTGIVLGSGGGARAAVVALDTLCEIIVVRARDSRKANALCTLSPKVVVEPLAPGDAESTTLFVVQATSAGMSGADEGAGVAAAVAWGKLPSYAVAHDLVYAPPLTPFLAAAQARGLPSANGLMMLARQGGLAFERWLGAPAPLAAMIDALR